MVWDLDTHQTKPLAFKNRSWVKMADKPQAAHLTPSPIPQLQKYG